MGKIFPELMPLKKWVGNVALYIARLRNSRAFGSKLCRKVDLVGQSCPPLL